MAAIQNTESDEGWMSGTLADWAEEFGYASESEVNRWLEALAGQRMFEVARGDTGIVYVRMIERGYKLAGRLLPAEREGAR
jgi:hypothetical protein